MKVLVYDVETTGIPEKYAKINQTNRWPYIVQFSWLLFDTSKNSLISVDDHIIQLPKNLKMAPGSIKIHGITNKQMRAEGKDIITILNKFQNSVNSANILVAHNLDFDTNMISVEQLRNIVPKNKRFRLLVNNRTKKYCTMKRGKTIANIKMYSEYLGKTIIKYPKLVELHRTLFNSIPNNLHNSLIDILVCFRCFAKLYWDIDILEKNEKLNLMWCENC